jgi:hypothetical protein
LIFATSRGPAEPTLYWDMFEEQGLSPEEEADLEWEAPETEGDVARMMAEMRATGWSG